MTNLFKNREILNLFTQNIKKDENISLSKSAVGDYSVLTTSNVGNRNPYPSGIFLPKFCLSSSYQVFLDTFLKAWLPQPHLSKAEFVEWLISRDKPSNRTNKASRTFAVVETIPHPLQGGNSLLTKQTEITMKPNSHLADFAENLTACIAPLADKFNCQPKTTENGSQHPEQKTILPSLAVIGYPFGVVAKSTASREKLNDLQMANNSTPLNRAFFVRSLRTPNENERNFALVLLSMVGRIGQRLDVGCVPFVAVSHPDTSYRPAVRSKAVALDFTNGAIEMIYKFLVLGEKRLTISIRAKSEAEARQKLQFTSPALCVARLKGGIYA